MTSSRVLAAGDSDAPWGGVSPGNAVADLVALLGYYTGAAGCGDAAQRLLADTRRFQVVASLDNQLRADMQAALRALLGDRNGVSLPVLERVLQAVLPPGIMWPHCVTVGDERHSWFVPPPSRDGVWTSCILYDRSLEDRVVAQRALLVHPAGVAETPEAILGGMEALVRLLLQRGHSTDANQRRLQPEDRKHIIEDTVRRLMALARGATPSENVRQWSAPGHHVAPLVLDNEEQELLLP